MAKAKKRVAASLIDEMENITLEVNDNTQTDASYIQATEEIIQAVEELKRFQELKKRLQNVEDHYRDKIPNFMQCHQQLKNGVFTLATWKTHSRSSFDTSASQTYRRLTLLQPI